MNIDSVQVEPVFKPILLGALEAINPFESMADLLCRCEFRTQREDDVRLLFEEGRHCLRGLA
jgi:hypothetical protein